MLFNSYEFILFFLPLTLAVYYFAAHRLNANAARLWLVLASLFFYGWWNPRYLYLLVGSMLGNYWLGKRLELMSTETKLQKITLAGGIAANLAFLGWYKYANFFVRQAGALLGWHWTLGNIILPLGISFFTFLQIGYLVDAAQGKTREYRFSNYALFVTFFPHLVAGPIVHHSDLMPQFAREETFRFDVRRFAAGFTLFTLGLAKKLLIADLLAPDAEHVFAAAGGDHGLRIADAWAGMGAYTFQIYFDFSGYSDMAIGLGLLFGVMLPFNFDSPYKSLSVVEFWRRWHMTLSRFFRDYLYIPLGGNRRGAVRVCGNLLLTMALAGFWHGANWTFLLWGIAHGVALAANHLWRLYRPLTETAGRATVWWLRGLCWGATFLFVTLAWVLFRAENLTDAGRYFGALVGLGPGAGGAAGLVKSGLFVYLALLLVFTCSFPNTQQLLQAELPLPVAPSRWHWRPTRGLAVVLGLLFAACVLSLSHVSQFIYWQF
jgi:D-alanyl-lipoteichoic acid acyltransferase DltB (MBOAT superfamily)